MEARVRLLEQGVLQNTFVKRVAELESLLDAATLENFAVVNDGTQPITDVAREIFTAAGWP
jgi:hypothetical protein